MKNFIINYKENGEFKKLIVEAENLDKAEKFFNNYNSDAELYGVVERTDIEAELNEGIQLVSAN